MNLSLNGKTALVCGSTQGIGRAAAHELALAGASVVLLARNKEKLEEVHRSLNISGEAKHEYLVADFSDPDEVYRIVSAFIQQHGPVHILVNNTGGPPAGTVAEAQPAEFIQAFNHHLVCNHLLTKAVLPGMISSGYGRIINIISTSVKIPLKGLGVSNTIRAAVANWSKTLSAEVARHQITVNNVLPGATFTGRLESIIANKAGKLKLDKRTIEEEMLAEIPAGRFGKAEEVAAAIAFLASPAAGYINGINLPVDGGRTGCL